jgi:branched-chain amino acid transport system substrate-binding protein
MSKKLVIVAGVLLLFLTACGSGKDESSTSSATRATGSETPGVSDTEVILGTHLPLSQSPAAAYAPYADGMRAYFDYINSQGGIYGRKITLLVGDDHYNPPDALEVVRKLVEQNQVFAIVGGMGDPTHLAVYKYLEENGVPDLFVGGGMEEFSNPFAKTRIVMMARFETEAEIGAEDMKERFAGKRMGIVYQSDAAGTFGMERLTELLKGSDVQIVSKQSYDWGQFDLTPQMQRVKSANPDVVTLMANPGAAASAIKVAREVLDWDVPFTTSASSAVEMMIDLAGAENAEGVSSLSVGKMISEKDDPGVQRHIELMKEFAPSVIPSSLTELGMAVAEYMVQALKNAGPDLTRESIIQGAENIRDFCCLACLLPGNLSPTDHLVEEAMWFERVENGQWVRFGDPVSHESTPGNVVACKGAGEPVYAGEGE